MPFETVASPTLGATILWGPIWRQSPKTLRSAFGDTNTVKWGLSPIIPRITAIAKVNTIYYKFLFTNNRGSRHFYNICDVQIHK